MLLRSNAWTVTPKKAKVEGQKGKGGKEGEGMGGEPGVGLGQWEDTSSPYLLSAAQLVAIYC